MKVISKRAFLQFDRSVRYKYITQTHTVEQIKEKNLTDDNLPVVQMPENPYDGI
jgi:hypothetical protein